MIREVLEYLGLKPGEVVADCTVGRGGHAVRMAGQIVPGGTLLGMDVDPDNLKYARQRMEAEGPKEVQYRWFHANFGELPDVLAAAGLEGVDGLLADLGVSTNQLLEDKHGLSFNADLALDMRLDPRIKKRASDLLRELEEEALADILFHYAQERYARRIARKIAQTRSAEPILTTGQLARLVRSVVPAKWGQIDPATRTFQALRMAVNEEMSVLEDLLAGVPEVLKAGGRAVFISFHSGEDRMVKQAMRAWQEQGRCEVLTKKPLEPGEEEMNRNPRSRSAKLRAVKWN